VKSAKKKKKTEDGPICVYSTNEDLLDFVSDGAEIVSCDTEM